tara:strand:- start:7187 stop:7732 length:546 start_codon:yes stop_codon:yes gene_type:complete
VIETLKQRYKVIYADPPWYFKSFSKKGEARSATRHYNCMSVDDICNIDVNRVADDNSVLLMWVTDPYLLDAFKVMESWGFNYKTVGFTWVKTNKSKGYFTGMGYWTRSNPEMCLLGTKGKPKRLDMSVKQLVVSQRREHSRKPDEVYDRIEKMLEGPYLEMFARNTRQGWDNFGNEVNKFD